MTEKMLDLRGTLEACEREAIKAALDKHEGNRSKAAKSLGINRTTLIEKIKKFGLQTYYDETAARRDEIANCHKDLDALAHMYDWHKGELVKIDEMMKFVEKKLDEIKAEDDEQIQRSYGGLAKY